MYRDGSGIDVHDERDVQPAAGDPTGAVADVGGGDGDAHVPVPMPVEGRQRPAIDRDVRTPVTAPAGPLERVLAALAGTTNADASWADPADAGDEASALSRLLSPTGVMDPVRDRHIGASR